MLLVLLAVSRPWCPGVNVDTSQVTRKTSLVHFTRGDYEIWITNTNTLTHLPPDWYTGLRYAALFGRDIPCYHADFTHPLSATTSLRAALRLKNVFNSGFIKTTQSRHGKVRVGLETSWVWGKSEIMNKYFVLALFFGLTLSGKMCIQNSVMWWFDYLFRLWTKQSSSTILCSEWPAHLNQAKSGGDWLLPGTGLSIVRMYSQ